MKPDDQQWVESPFKTSTDGPPATQQVMSGPAVVCPQGTPPPPPHKNSHRTLVNCARTIEKATLVPMKTLDGTTNESVLIKSVFVRQLSLQPGEVDEAFRMLSKGSALSHRDAINLLKAFEGSPMSSQQPLPTAFASMSVRDLSLFGEAIQEMRKEAVKSSGAIPESLPKISKRVSPRRRTLTPR
jgi:hypothetical protein